MVKGSIIPYMTGAGSVFFSVHLFTVRGFAPFKDERTAWGDDDDDGDDDDGDYQYKCHYIILITHADTGCLVVLDLFKLIFCGFSHGIHHHRSPPIWENIWMVHGISIRIEESQIQPGSLNNPFLKGGCLVISNHFLCRVFFNHPIETTIKKLAVWIFFLEAINISEKRNYSLPTIHFQVLCHLSFRPKV